MLPHHIVKLIERSWNGKRILVVGDAMLDKYIHGSVDRISPEAPVPVVHATRRNEQPGGAANVAMNIASLGACAIIVGFVGHDEDGLRLTQLLKATGIEVLFVTVPETPTTSKLRILGGSQQIVRLDFETVESRPASGYSAIIEQVLAVLPRVDGVVLSDYAKGTLTAELCQTIIGEARRLDLPVFVDPKSRDFTRYRGATSICPNLKELALATGSASTDLDTVLDAGHSLMAELGCDYLIVTLGEKGISVLGAARAARFYSPAVARQVFDVSGAGDTVIAILALAAVCAVPIEDSVRIANTAAGIVVGKLGTVPIARNELVAALTDFSSTEASQKTLDFTQLLIRASEWRAAGHTIVFTNGCFDILHVGHISLLEDCRRFGDKVVVGINSDASVSRLKGPGRPIVGERERARILAALAATDAIVVFDAPTPIDLVLALRPEVLVKGGDYREETIVGAPEVKSWGGRVIIVPTVEGHSTTNMVRRLVAHEGN
jgi:D-beta-D-heptose 7-phosphate kinase/D-beta-D-heptose 1-phosphate adenosyltransferase